MRKLDFISIAPNLSIFKTGANKKKFGGILSLIYIIIFISFVVIYIYDYAKQDRYSYEYSYRKNDTKIMEEEQAESIMNTELDFCFLLDKENNDLLENDNFLIIEVGKLERKIFNKKGLDAKDNYTIINSDDNLIDEFIIRK